MSENRVNLDEIINTRYSRFLTYPSSEAEGEAKERVQQLKEIGISSLIFKGSTSIDGVQVLGKGCVGIVAEGLLGKTLVAVKIRRLDADRASLLDEARYLRLANSVDVGPALITATQNMLVMQLVNGQPLFKWVERARRRAVIRSVLRQLLLDCFKLDAIGLDHGELSHAPRNVLVNPRNEPCIVDFESASSSRRVANVTSLIQYFLFGQLARSFGGRRLYHNQKTILHSLTLYKQDGSVSNFENILHLLRV
jgi:putative serine/threonine protein kinase